MSAAFNLIPTDLPAVVALSGKRMRFASLPKVSGSEGVVSFIDGVLGGSIRTTMLQVRQGGPSGKRASPETACPGVTFAGCPLSYNR